MIFHIAYFLTQYWTPFNVVHYISFRAIAALLSTLASALFFGDWFITHSKRFFRSKAREWTPDSHKAKDNLPTMGGIFIISIVGLNIFLWCNLLDPHVWSLLGILVGFGAIGAWDDMSKIRHNKGINAKTKFGLQCLVSFIMVCFWLFTTQAPLTITFPFFKNLQPSLGIFFIVWAMFVVIGCSNGVNLTDGLDGLAIGSLLPNFATFALLCYLAGNMKIASYLHIPFVHTSELAIIGATLVGASLGFLWYNTYPAQIFMGDVGSLALGGALGSMALMCKQELLLIISGGIFVMETISVILQVLTYKWYGKRLFRMAPIHHHFELIGWPESRITVRFGIISFILCLIALITIKIR